MIMSKKKAVCASLMALVLFILCQLVSQIVASLMVNLGVPVWICNALAGIMYLALTIVSVKLFYERVMKIPLSEFGITRVRFKLRWALIGILLPVLVLGCYFLFVPGQVVASDMGTGEALVILSAGIFFGGLGAGVVEEIVFRGVIFRSLEKAWNTKVAVIVPSLLFGVVHILGMQFTFGSCLLVIVAGCAVGIMFSLIAMESGAIWSNALVHMLWNCIIIGGVLNVASKADTGALMTYVVETNSFAITGGEFGIESSVIALTGYILVSLFAVWMLRKNKKA